jgi:hypothetical protein
MEDGLHVKSSALDGGAINKPLEDKNSWPSGYGTRAWNLCACVCTDLEGDNVATF